MRRSSRAGRDPRPAPAGERGILLEHPGLQLLERRRGLEPERLDQRGAPGAEHLERLGLPAGAVERDHQLAAQALVERMLRHELLELGHELGAAAELELGLEALLRDRQAQLAQALDHGTRERLEREIGERLAPPQGERLAGRAGRPSSASPAASAEPAASARRSKTARSRASGATRIR